MKFWKTFGVVTAVLVLVMSYTSISLYGSYHDTLNMLNDTQKKLEETESLLEDSQEAIEAITLNESYIVNSIQDVTYVTDTDIVNTSDYLTKEAGRFYVDNGNGGYNCETYHSSKFLIDYRVDKWNADGNGIYRDSDGYIVCEVLVVSDSQIKDGDVIETSLGQARVYSLYEGCDGKVYKDSNGNTSNIHTISIYTNW